MCQMWRLEVKYRFIRKVPVWGHRLLGLLDRRRYRNGIFVSILVSIAIGPIFVQIVKRQLHLGPLQAFVGDAGPGVDTNGVADPS